MGKLSSCCWDYFVHISSAAIMSRPTVSSPLTGNASPRRAQSTAQLIAQRRNSSFPSSRALRPFPSIAQSLGPSCSDKKAIKIIEAPKHQQTMFVLDLTQAELSRQGWTRVPMTVLFFLLRSTYVYVIHHLYNSWWRATLRNLSYSLHLTPLIIFIILCSFFF